jgi:hypothetical protein
MLDELRSSWSRDMTWDDISVFCQLMTEERQKIKEARGIKPARMNCKCGGRMVLAPISIRSLLFALRRVERIDDAELKKLDREWGKYRRANGLDAYGKRPES